jgi:uncharacterized membrane protein YfcA
LSAFVGFGASAIGITAWPLIVPLLFVFAGFNLYLTLFISLLMDCGNAFVMMLVAGQHRLVDVKLGLLLAAFALIWIAAGIWLGAFFIPGHEDLFRGAASLISIFFGIAFLAKGFRARRQRKVGRRRAGRMTRPFAAHRSSLNRYRSRLIYPAVAALGLQIGLFGIGGGMWHSVFLMALLGYPTLAATGTAMLITFIATLFAACAMFFQIPADALDNVRLIQFVPLIVAMSMLGTQLGAKISYALNEERVNYLIGAVVLTAGLLAALQKIMVHLL